MRRIEREKTGRFEPENDGLAHRLPTARAVFRPQSNSIRAENIQSEAIFSAATHREVGDLLDPIIPGHMSSYRISLFAVGREELAGILPEQREAIEQFSDLQVEELATQIEEALTEFYRMTLRAVLMNYLGNPPAQR